MTDTTRLAERAVLSAIIEGLATHNYVPVAVYDGEEYNAAYKGMQDTDYSIKQVAPSFKMERSLTLDECLSIIYSVDDISTVHFADAQALDTWGRRGVMVTPGNGRDFASDWHGIGGAFGEMVWTAIKDLYL